MTKAKELVSQPPVAPGHTSSIWDGVHKNKRYLSHWEDNTVVIDVRVDGRPQVEPVAFPLAEITLAVFGDLSIYSNEPVPLTNFPNLVAALKISINSTIHAKTANFQNHVTKIINQSARFFSFCIGKGVYNLVDVSRDLTTDYQDHILRLGWWSANNYNLHLRRFLRRLNKSELLQKKIRRETSNNNVQFSLNIEQMQSLTGLRIPSNSLPQWFYQAYRKLTNEPKSPSSSGGKRVEPSEQSCCRALTTVNCLCFSHAGFDAISFIAFPNAAKTCEEFFKKNRRDTRTKTLTLPISVTIVQQSIRWLYEYGPTLIEILNEIRDKLEDGYEYNNALFTRRQTVSHKSFRTGIEGFQSRHQLPLSKLNEPGSDTEKIRLLTTTYLSALFFNIAATTARRRKEVTGEDRIYGLYFGCLRKVQEDSEDYKADFYIEKTLRDYEEFWVPKICVDSIKALEELFQVFRPLGSDRKIKNQNLSEARKDKLFKLNNFKSYVPHITEEALFSISEHSEHFFHLCDIDRNIIFNRNDKNVFRRFYCNLYVNRYDNPVAAALQHHLDHSHMGVTAIYGLDPHGRSPDEKSATLFRQAEADDESFSQIMAEVSQEHHVAKLVDLLDGKAVGGLYSKLILKLTIRLSKDISFALSPIETKATILADRMKSRGFASEEKSHGMCMAGTARHTVKRAHCSNEEGIHPEIASPNLCKGCINLMNPEGYQLHLANERDALLAEAADMTLPRALREAKKRDAADIESYLEADRRIAESNKQILLKLVDSWSKLEELSDE
ncbi:hypothetical protein [Paraburkholderia youngii]|uniref:hypothetical protein n=1 Tax=Paraburkholderia youngii TaxID=2782701 RepID=UPI003D209EF2